MLSTACSVGVLLGRYLPGVETLPCPRFVRSSGYSVISAVLVFQCSLCLSAPDVNLTMGLHVLNPSVCVPAIPP